MCLSPFVVYLQSIKNICIGIFLAGFIWGNKTPKFRREIMETLPCLGGFKLTNLRVFDTALKLTWLKRLLTQSYGWAEFPIKFRILDILKYGDNFPTKIITSIHNIIYPILSFVQVLLKTITGDGTECFGYHLYRCCFRIYEGI